MRVVNAKALTQFWAKCLDAGDPLQAWYAEAQQARWTTPTDITEGYTRASVLKNSRAVFRIRGNKYRLVIQINYSVGIVRIRFVGTHEEYDKINAETV